MACSSSGSSRSVPCFRTATVGTALTPSRSSRSLQPRHDALVARLVRHVHREEQRHAHLRELDGDHEGTAHVPRVAHLEDARARLPHQDVPRDPLVLGHGEQRVHPRRVDDLVDRPPVPRLPSGDLDRGPGIIGHVHVPPRERAENDALPDVRVPHQDHGGGLRPRPCRRGGHPLPFSPPEEAHLRQRPKISSRCASGQETVPARHEVLELFDVGILELDDLPAGGADEMVVVGREVAFVPPRPVPEIELLGVPHPGEELQGPVDGDGADPRESRPGPPGSARPR